MSVYQTAFVFNLLVDGIIYGTTIVCAKIWHSEGFTWSNDVVFILMVHFVMLCLLGLLWKVLSLEKSTCNDDHPAATSFLIYTGIMCIIFFIYFGYSVTTLIYYDISSMEYSVFICRVLSGPLAGFYSIKLFIVYRNYKETEKKEDLMRDMMGDQLIS